MNYEAGQNVQCVECNPVSACRAGVTSVSQCVRAYMSVQIGNLLY